MRSTPWSARTAIIAPWVVVVGVLPALAQSSTPHNQDKPPGPPLSPQQAIAQMTVPEGFEVELVASEPQIVNPVAMTFDERGRVWITESLEYPRRDAGPGRDRVKILEDTDQDGRADKFTVFADGLNIPSGIAVGHGGVWVANAPDILFLQDADGDGQAERREVVVTGFGRTDTHELPNSLTWGPDGWLYGLNGVFNHSHVRYAESNPNYQPDHPGWQFTCAMFRIHPRTREFQVFAEGTSNPWGIAFDTEGSAFISACVIDHLWHIVETGYYHRQGGPYPAFTWKIESIVKHKHQKAAYCGLHFFDSDAYPEGYREKLYMGNIHGGCINVDKLRREGSTYFATPEPDFLTANDAWFMPVVQKTGPDGCLYILDWYDRYHCYQDANRDPAGIDRMKGRLYRVRYKETPRAPKFDLARESDEELIARLGSGNVYFRDTAQRVLAERNSAAIRAKLEELLQDESAPRKQRIHALFARLACGGSPATRGEDIRLLDGLLRSPDATFRAMGIRAAGDFRHLDSEFDPRIRAAASSAASAPPDVLLQAAIYFGKRRDAVGLLQVLESAGGDKLIPHIVWQNLHPLLEHDQHLVAVLQTIRQRKLLQVPSVASLVPRLLDRIWSRSGADAALLAELFQVRSTHDVSAARQCLAMLAARVQTGEIKGQRLADLRTAFGPVLAPLVRAGAAHPLGLDAAMLTVAWKDAAGLKSVRLALQTPGGEPSVRLRALESLIAAGDEELLEVIAAALKGGAEGEFRGQLLAALGRLNDDRVADVVLGAYASLEPDLRPKAVELLTQRIPWAKKLLAAIGQKQVPSNVLNENQVRRLLAARDADLTKLVTDAWGSIRTERDPQREQFVARMRKFIREHPGDAEKGAAVYQKVCGQCHKLHGQGHEVGPDLTTNGRGSYEQLLSNVFDPSLVIGAAYQARQLITSDGRTLTGLLVEESPQRVVLKVQGGKLETIPRGEIEQYEVSKLSMMPEGLEKQLTPAELADLFAYITLDKPPGDPSAKRLPGVYEVVPRETSDPNRMSDLLQEVAPGFSTTNSGEKGVAVLATYRSRKAVVRTHPEDRGKPCVIEGEFELPPAIAGKQPRLAISASHHVPTGDWQLVVRVNGKMLYDDLVGEKTVRDGWLDVRLDLGAFSGQRVKIEIENRPTGWNYEFAYWSRIELE